MFDADRLRKDFPYLRNHPDVTYLDNAATSLKPDCVIRAVTGYYENVSANAHRGDYDAGLLVNQELDACREAIRALIHAQKADEILFTSGSTAGLNTVAFGYGRKFLKPGDVILATEAEHASGILPWMWTAADTGAELRFVPLREDGAFSLEAFEQMLSERVKVVAIAQVTNVLGYVLPLREICELAHRYGAVVVADGSQSVPHMPVDVQQLDVDFLAFSGHKMCGPTGIGVLYGKAELLSVMDPLFYGGGSNAGYLPNGEIFLKKAPEKFESGTLPLAQIYGLRAAVGYLQNVGMDSVFGHELRIREYLMSALEKMDHIIVYNPNADSGIITFNLRQIHGQDAAKVLNRHGIAVRAGEHCSKLLEPRLGTNTTVRLSPYLYTTKQEADRFLHVCEMATKSYCLRMLFD